MINFLKLHKDAKIPVRGSTEAAGLDLFIIESVTIPPGHRALLGTGLAMSLPFGQGGFIEPRSKLASNCGITVLARVIDSDYRGEIMVNLLNTGLDPVELRAGDKAAQMVIQAHLSWQDIVEVDELDTTDRASEGINSAEQRLR